MIEPIVSIIVPAFNAEKFLDAMVESVLAQTFQEWELLLIDDHSTDQTSAKAAFWAAQDSRIHAPVLQSASPTASGADGPAATRNSGYTHANPLSTYIIFLDSDDEWEKDTLHTLVTSLDRCPEAIAAYGQAHWIGTEGGFVYRDGSPLTEGTIDAYPQSRNGASGNSVIEWPTADLTTFAVQIVDWHITNAGQVLVRRSSVESVGLFDTQFIVCEDQDWFVRLSRFGDLLFVPHPVLRYRLHADNISRDAYKMHLYMGYVIWKALFDPTNTPAQRQAALIGAILTFTSPMTEEELSLVSSLVQSRRSGMPDPASCI